jgi:hypothetical protein
MFEADRASACNTDAALEFTPEQWSQTRVDSYNHGKPVAIEGCILFRSRLHRRIRRHQRPLGWQKGTDLPTSLVWAGAGGTALGGKGTMTHTWSGRRACERAIIASVAMRSLILTLALSRPAQA